MGTDMRSIAFLALLAQTDALLVPSLKSRIVQQPALKPIIQRTAMATTSVLPLVTSLPALAVTEASDIDDLAGPLTAGIAVFVAIIAYFAFAAASEVADQTDERMDRLGMKNKKNVPGRRLTTTYDDTDYTYSANQKAVQNSRDRKKKSKQFGKDGKRLAPWMIIDEKRVDASRAARRENKRKTGKFFG